MAAGWQAAAAAAAAAWAVAVGSAAAFSGMAVCRVRDTPIIQGRRLSPVRIQVLGACGIWIVLAGFPPLALCVVTGAPASPSG